MYIETFVLGDLETNCYCVRADVTHSDCIIIDVGMHPFALIQHLQNENLNPVAILLTHGHIDHIGGLELLRELWPKVQVYIHKSDAEMLTDPEKNLSAVAGTIFQARPADILLDGHSEIRIAGLRFEVLLTPGHTPGGISLHCPSEGIIFVGDSLFAGGIGRTDFPGGSHEILIQSIKTKLLSLPEITKVYSGHGPSTSIRNEKRFNQFLL